MKTKEYIKKYDLDKNDKFNHTDFINDLFTDFLTLLETSKGRDNIKGFENAINAIRMKWDVINNKTVGSLSEGLWKYFYASKICQLREKLFPEELRRRKKQKEDWEKQKEERKRFFEGSFGYEDWWNGFIASLIKTNQRPTEAIIFFELGENFSVDDIKKKYRELSRKHHPDMGGKQENFVKITEYKNKLLSYVSNKN